jgi:hypothetical protein
MQALQGWTFHPQHRSSQPSGAGRGRGGGEVGACEGQGKSDGTGAQGRGEGSCPPACLPNCQLACLFPLLATHCQHMCMVCVRLHCLQM